MKMQISFLIEKIQMQISFLIEKNSDLHLMKMQINFWFEKILDLHLMKMQIIFFFKYDNKQIFERKKKDLDKKNVKTIF